MASKYSDIVALVGTETDIRKLPDELRKRILEETSHVKTNSQHEQHRLEGFVVKRPAPFLRRIIFRAIALSLYRGGSFMRGKSYRV
jgi:hypothetical protein